jgi:hypothetical protein
LGKKYFFSLFHTYRLPMRSFSCDTPASIIPYDTELIPGSVLKMGTHILSELKNFLFFKKSIPGKNPPDDQKFSSFENNFNFVSREFHRR